MDWSKFVNLSMIQLHIVFTHKELLSVFHAALKLFTQIGYMANSHLSPFTNEFTNEELQSEKKVLNFISL